jgi:hypothetical protein
VIDSSSFWNHIGLIDLQYLLISLPVDSVIGIDSAFTEGIVLDTNFMSGGVPVVTGNVDSILAGVVDGWGEINTTFISDYDSLNVIVDLYNLVYHPEFLEKVIERFGLNASPTITVTSPNGGELWLMGDLHNITWSSNKVDSVKIELSLHNGLLWYTITESTASDGIYEWVVQAPQTSLECRIKITDLIDTTVSDCSDTTFVIDMFPSVDDSINSISPTEFALMQNYPNPFNPATKIKFTIPTPPVRQAGYQGEGNRERFVTLKVYDVLGNEIATLINEEKQAGIYEVEFSAIGGSASGGDAVKLPSGIYFYKLQVYPANSGADSFIETKKMLLLK